MTAATTHWSAKRAALAWMIAAVTLQDHHTYATMIRDLLYPRQDMHAAICQRSDGRRAAAAVAPTASGGPAAVVHDDDGAIRLATDAVNNITTFSSGNRAINDLMRNCAGSIGVLAQPFPYVYIPLDEDGTRDILRTDASIAPRAVFVDESVGGRSRFDASERLYRQQMYNDMTRAKWETAARWARKGARVLMTDPDIVYLRNPLPYLASLPQCDFTIQTEVSALRMFDGMTPHPARRARSLDGFTAHATLTVNTGFVLFQPSAAALALINLTMHVVAVAREQGSNMDDQTAFNTIMDEVYYIEDVDDISASHVTVAASSDGVRVQTTDKADPMTLSTRYRRMAREQSRGRCLRFQPRPGRRVIGDLPAPPFTMWLLSPLLFPLRPTYQLIDSETSAHEWLGELPYLVHYNWAQPLARKRALMEASCHWDARLP